MLPSYLIPSRFSSNNHVQINKWRKSRSSVKIWFAVNLRRTRPLIWDSLSVSCSTNRLLKTLPGLKNWVFLLMLYLRKWGPVEKIQQIVSKTTCKIWSVFAKVHFWSNFLTLLFLWAFQVVKVAKSSCCAELVWFSRWKKMAKISCYSSSILSS